MTYIVRLTEQGSCYGPFDELETAQGFADYLETEVDPAEVRKLADPVADLLSFRTQFMAGGQK